MATYTSHSVESLAALGLPHPLGLEVRYPVIVAILDGTATSGLGYGALFNAYEWIEAHQSTVGGEEQFLKAQDLVKRILIVGKDSNKQGAIDALAKFTYGRKAVGKYGLAAKMAAVDTSKVVRGALIRSAEDDKIVRAEQAQRNATMKQTSAEMVVAPTNRPSPTDDKLDRLTDLMVDQSSKLDQLISILLKQNQ